MNAIRGRVTESGRISLPADVRRALGLERGGDVVIELDGREIRIRTIDEVIANSQAIARRLLANAPGAGIDDFLAERRRDWSED
jgi:AbrB family looped-hinge helix DNA binding protein